MITLKKLSSCSLEEVTRLWNEGFSDYSFNFQMTEDDFVRRLTFDSLGTQYSWVACIEDKPAGMLLNGIQNWGGSLRSWNGGTVVHPQQRGKGIGKFLMDHTIQLYAEHGVDLASLEVLTSNQTAISLYKHYGYQVEQELVTLECTNLSSPLPQPLQCQGKYQLLFGHPSDVKDIDFYDNDAPWQAQWMNLMKGQSLIIKDQEGLTVCYALFKDTLNEPVANPYIRLSQCVLHPRVQALAEEILNTAFLAIFRPELSNCRRMTGDFITRDERIVKQLERWGFLKKSERYLMLKRFA